MRFLSAPARVQLSARLWLQTNKVETLDLDRTLSCYGQFTSHMTVTARWSGLERDVVVVGFIDSDELNRPIRLAKRHQGIGRNGRFKPLNECFNTCPISTVVCFQPRSKSLPCWRSWDGSLGRRRDSGYRAKQNDGSQHGPVTCSVPRSYKIFDRIYPILDCSRQKNTIGGYLPCCCPFSVRFLREVRVKARNDGPYRQQRLRAFGAPRLQHLIAARVGQPRPERRIQECGRLAMHSEVVYSWAARSAPGLLCRISEGDLTPDSKLRTIISDSATCLRFCLSERSCSRGERILLTRSSSA